MPVCTAALSKKLSTILRKVAPVANPKFPPVTNLTFFLKMLLIMIYLLMDGD